MQTPIKHIIFDMGGVLVQIRWHEEISRILGRDVPFEDIHALWGNARSTHAFETGQMDFETFTDAFLDEFNLTLDRTDFQQRFKGILGDDFPGVLELLDALKPQYTLSLLSNTNACHWGMLVDRNTFLPKLDHHFTSMELGVMKPDAAIYRAVLDTLETEPEETLFFDDGIRNVEAARALGMQSEQVFGPGDMSKVLKHKSLMF
ncbi:HAD family hydrolase [Saccharospirillum salsuginis]|uniref:Hydrolase n=1 Tax=Saccharospirillum salsuginis TaxID=418750 RepID=A0A918K544_9GAMM|nr:HAD family phosphatase [Saccharospirillum salsuginis]GGX49956.1 hydrolase [Saccharospirillum salsuginis]